MTLIAFHPYGSECLPDAIVADLDPDILKEWAEIAGGLKGVAFSVNFTWEGGTIEDYPWPDEDDLGDPWLVPDGIEIRYETTLVTVFPDGDFYVEVLQKYGDRIESEIFAVKDIEKLING